MRDIALALFIVGMLPLVIRRPIFGVLLWVWLSLMAPHRFTYGFAYDFQFAALVAGCTLIGVVMTKEEIRYQSSTLLILLLVFPLWTLVTFMFALEPEQAMRRMKEVPKTFLFVHLCAMVLRSRRHIDWLIWVIVVSVGFFGVKGGIFTLLDGAGRVWGPPGDTYLSDNNAIAVAIIMVIPLMYYLRAVSQSRWVRHALLASMLLCGMAVLGTYSRGGFLAVSAMLLYLWFRSQRKVVFALILVPLVPVAIAFMPDRWGERMDTISTYEQDGSAMGRINTWKMLANLANDRPIVGGGFEPYSPATSARYSNTPEPVRSAHSIYFQVLGEHGYVGLLIFISIGVAAWATARRTVAAARAAPEHAWAGALASAIQVSLLGYAVGGAFVNIAYWDFVYYTVVALSVACGLVVPARRPASRPHGGSHARA
jgi:probable O-glycosylation ligase (exosortase A-associated)